MATPQDAYVPVDCEFHDRLESACVLREDVKMRIQTDAGETSVQARILNVYAVGTEEFMQVDGIGEVRLDRVTLENE